MRPMEKEPRESMLNWLWMIAIVLTLLLFVSAAMAGTVTVSFQELDRDLARCRFTLQNAQGAAIDSKEVTAFNDDQIHQAVLNFDTRLLQGTAGRVVGWCVDAAGQTSVDSAALAAQFPDVIPAPPVLVGVQIVP